MKCPYDDCHFESDSSQGISMHLINHSKHDEIQTTYDAWEAIILGVNESQLNSEVNSEVNSESQDDEGVVNSEENEVNDSSINSVKLTNENSELVNSHERNENPTCPDCDSHERKDADEYAVKYQDRLEPKHLLALGKAKWVCLDCGSCYQGDEA